MFWSMIVFLGPSQWHYNLRLTERAKMTLSRAQNIVMPKNINFVLFHCKGTFGPERYLRTRLEICRTLRTFTCAPSFIREWMWTFRCPPRDSTVVCQYVDVNFNRNFQFPRQFHFCQTDNQRVVLFTMFSLLELFFSCCRVVAVAKENLLETPAIISFANFQRIQILRCPRLAFDWLSVSFFLLLTNQNVWFVTSSSLHWIDPPLH